ncbi:accessory gene regulator ArgB-like protein [Brevibacillus reuszeri]|uniref:accessory gene regulator ArgB-like protein n=1 Tax=Brevibacillus reuszeri TaxID=54915 RepID=UPI003D1AB798
MTWTERLSLRIAQSIKTEETHYSIGQLAHGIEIFVLNVMSGIVIVVLSLLFGLIGEVIPLVCFFFLLRLLTGGVHLKNPWTCLTFTVSLMISGGILIKNLPEFSGIPVQLILLLLGGTGFVINYFYAPAKHTYMPTDPKIQSRNRKIVLILIGIGCLSSSTLIGYSYRLSMTYILAVLLQSVLLMPGTFRIISYLENKS